MIGKYRTPEMQEIWSLEHQYEIWWEVERAALKGWVEVGEVDRSILERVDERVDWSVDRIKEHEARLRHDMLAFLETIEESVGELLADIHKGMTSSDVQDTEKSLRIGESIDLLQAELEELKDVLEALARKHKETVMMGRTHGVHAEPITFGLKCLVWLEECRRQTQRLRDAREQIHVGQISGAVGTFAQLDPRVQEIACEELGLQPARISTQILQRDRHAHVAGVLANLAGTIEKMAVEVRNLQRTEILEVQESFKEGQKGSSAMPHKKNPIIAERLSGQARCIRGYASTLFETQALWHERDLSNSSTERIVFPDVFQLMHYMLRHCVDLFGNLGVHADRMRENIEITHGLIFSQQVLLALSRVGWDRSRAYERVQTLAMRSWENGSDFEQLVRSDEEITAALDDGTLRQCFDVQSFLTHLDTLYDRVLGTA